VQRGFWWGNLLKINNLVDLSFDGRMILKLIFKKWNRDMDWFALAQDKDKWPAVVNAVMNLRFPYNEENFLTSGGSGSFSRRTLMHGVIYLFR